MAVLREAADIVDRKWHSVGKGWKVFIFFAVLTASLVGLCYLVLLLLGRLVKSLTAGGYRNQNLYIPKVGRRRF